jgi:peptide/nickel transport system substrate-binding protein
MMATGTRRVRARLDRILLLPMPEANTRLAALRSGQVDWIEVPPPDAIASLRAAGFTVTTGSYPHVWPWFFQMNGENTPFRDVRVRQALNYCVDRDGLVQLLNGTAEPSVGWLKPSDPAFGAPEHRYRFDAGAQAAPCWPRPASTRSGRCASG